ncbi:ABC transporter permease [Blastococcus xanthinilyticus]|uniref:ABC-2 family transporter n=1 Tax=Blastococcus xanthinilyticus TaxID=1564164 RepID=A0A5S5CQ91_9ACTN|nr:ABC transporter permease [Blastococcus xanthinilyticus]TYP85863.1 ABC-2 family transporter [Blastococcus xanthinilyticus]
MMRLVRAEWTKLFTTRVWIGLLLGAVALAVLSSVILTAFAGDPEVGIPAVGTPLYEQLALAGPSNSVVLMLVLGVIGTTQEYRHRTATPTFLATPQRGRVVAAKVLAYALVAVPFALVVTAVNYAVLAVYAGARGAVPGLTGDNLRVVLTAALALVIYTVIGVGLGALIRNQVGAIVGALVYLFVIEALIRQFIGGAYKWLPGGGLEALTATFEGPDLLEAWQGGVLLLGYGLVAAVLGTLLAVRRDIV